MPEGTICRIRIDEPDASSMYVVETPGRYPRAFSVSPSGRYLAYEYAHEVSIVELSSRSVVSTWQTPWPLYGWRLGWTHDEKHLIIGSSSWYSQTGTWVLDINKNEATPVLPQLAHFLSLSPDKSGLVITVIDETWLADARSDIAITKAFGLAMTPDQFLAQRVQRWTERIEANPEETELYLQRALTYMSLQEYGRAKSDLQTFTMLMTPSDKHLYYMMCWWGWRYCFHNLYDGGELLMLPAAELLPLYPDTQLGLYGHFNPVLNLVSLYERCGKPKLAEKWRAKLPQEKSARE